MQKNPELGSPKKKELLTETAESHESTENVEAFETIEKIDAALAKLKGQMDQAIEDASADIVSLAAKIQKLPSFKKGLTDLICQINKTLSDI